MRVGYHTASAKRLTLPRWPRSATARVRCSTVPRCAPNRDESSSLATPLAAAHGVGLRQGVGRARQHRGQKPRRRRRAASSLHEALATALNCAPRFTSAASSRPRSCATCLRARPRPAARQRVPHSRWLMPCMTRALHSSHEVLCSFQARCGTSLARARCERPAPQLAPLVSI